MLTICNSTKLSRTSKASSTSAGTVTSRARRREKFIASVQKGLRVCVSRTCRKQGAQQVLKLMQDLVMDSNEICVTDCSCLGDCGSGPNMVLVPEGKQLNHVATVEDAIEVLTELCGISIPREVIQAQELKLLGNAAAISGRLEDAITRFSQAIALKPSIGLHLLLCNRASAQLELGKPQEALVDAQQAVALAPPSFINGWVRLVDCQYALQMYPQAAETARLAVQRCPHFKNTSEYRLIVKALEKFGQAV